MSLYGALYSGVSGLKAQGSKIGIISDNISNVNTVGYKAGSAQFETLVTGSSSTVAYSPGGVRGGNRQLVDKQGLLLTTDSPTDIAVSGNGFFAVNARADGTDQPLYTRAGSFRQDNLGNFVNANGFFLQGWPLDREGRLPGEPGNLNTTSFANLDSLETVNVESVSGVAASTSAVEVGANLDAGQTVFPGAGGTVDMDAVSAINFGIRATDLIAPDEFGLAPTNSLVRGDRMTVATGSGLSYTYQYGGFAIGRDVTTAGVGDGGVNTTTTLPAGSFASAVGSATVTVTHNGHNFGPVGSTRTITIGGIVAGDVAGRFTGIADVNGQRVITVTGANTYTFQASTAATAAGAFGAAGTDDNYVGNILDATSATQAFLTTNASSQFTSNALNFSINTTTTGTVTFRYVAASPNAASGQFNSLSNLATAINDVSGLTARVVNGRLLVGAENSSEAVTFTNGDATGSGVLGGIDWIQELDLANVGAAANRFNNLQELADLANASTGISATLTNPFSSTTVRIYNDDPLDTITFSDYVQTPPVAIPNNSLTIPATGAGLPVDIVVADAGHNFQIGDMVTFSGLTAGAGGLNPPLPNGTFQIIAVNAGVDYTFRIPGAQNPVGIAGAAGVGGAAGTTQLTNQGSVLAELGLVNSLNGGVYTPQTLGPQGPAYDASGVIGQNMASGDITAQFSRNVRIYDSLGSGHEVRMSFIKTAINTWAVEVHVIPETDISTTLVNGQIATGNIQFNGDGSLRSVDTALTNPITINWLNGAVASTVTFDWGTAGLPFGTVGATQIGLTDGLTQFDSEYNVAFVNQNGAPVGELISVTIDEDGFVIASYSNGESQRLYKLAIADFNNPNGLTNISGNVYAQSEASGEVNLREAGRNGVGSVVSGALESSNVELAEQLTDMIVAQRAYQANTRVITTTDQLLDELNRIAG